MYYGLAKKQDYFAERVNRFVALASCIFYTGSKYNYEETVKAALIMDNLGVYNFYGNDEGSL